MTAGKDPLTGTAYIRARRETMSASGRLSKAVQIGVLSDDLTDEESADDLEPKCKPQNSLPGKMDPRAAVSFLFPMFEARRPPRRAAFCMPHKYIN